MFKILILQKYYNLSDDQMEKHIRDRFSFMRFLDLTIADDIPDSRTVWKFKEQLVDLSLTEPMFFLFLKQIETLGMVLNEGKIITQYVVTTSVVHDSPVSEDLFSKVDKGQALFADSANSGEPSKEIINNCELENQTHVKGYKNSPLTEEDFENNRIKSTTRVRV